MIDNQRAALRYQNKVNNAQGHFFESAIKAACALYSDRERDTMKKQHTQKMTVRVTAQTAYNLERLMLMSGQKTPGRVVDKLVREKMLALRGRNIETEETK